LRAIWKYWDRKIVALNRAMPTNRLATVAKVTVRWRNSLSGRTGSLTRSSTTTAHASSRTPPAR